MRVLVLSSFGTTAANSVIFAALSDLQDKYGFNDGKLGLIAATGFVFGLLTQTFIAPYADRGHPKTMIVFGLIMAVVGSLLFANGTNLIELMIARGVVGMSIGSVLPSNRAIAANLAIEGRSQRMGRLAGWEMAGFVCGPLFGGLMLDPLGISSTFLVFGALALITLVALVPVRFPSLPTNDSSRQLSLNLLLLPKIQVAFLTAIAMWLPIGIYDALWDRYITDRGGSNTMVGLSFAMYSVPFILFAERGGKVSDKFGALRVALTSMFVIAPVTAGYGLLRVPIAIVMLSVLEGSVQALSNPAVQTLVSRAAPEGRAVAAQGLSGATTLFVGALTALVAPPIYGALGPEWTFSIIAMFMALFASAAWQMSKSVDLN